MAQTPPAPKAPAMAKPAGTAKPPAAAKPAAKPAAPKPPAPPPLTTDDQKTIYALGLSMARSLSQFDLSAAELDIVKRAISDAAANKPAVDLQEWGPKIQPLAMERGKKVAERNKATALAYLAKVAAEPGVTKSDSGLLYKEIAPGTGESPTATDKVKVNYRGTLIDGTEFDSSYKRGQAAEFPLNQVIKCWTEGVQKMKVGGKSQLVCPAEIAYGDQGRPSIPGGSTLIFEIELLEITK